MTSEGLRDRLAKGLYLDNVRSMARTCRELSISAERCLPYFVLSCILYGLADHWDERAVPTKETETAERLLIEPLQRVLVAIETGYSDEEVVDLLTQVIQAFFELLS